jgi:hypothetical protein
LQKKLIFYFSIKKAYFEVLHRASDFAGSALISTAKVITRKKDTLILTGMIFEN